MPPEPSHPVTEEIVAIAEHAGLGLVRFDRGLRVSAASPAVHQLLEWRPDTLVGRTAMETFLDHRAEAVIREAAAGSAGRLELTPSERRSYVLCALPAVGGGAWVTLEDVTELEHLRRIRGEFIDNLSHELRTPLASIRLLTEMLLGDLETADVPERVRERVATIDVETGHLAGMVNELLDLSRMEQASTQIRQDPVPLAPVVVAVLSRLRTFADRGEISLSSEVSPDLPLVRGDEERLDRLLLNLVHNAVKFSTPGGSVAVVAREEPDRLVASVSDQGVGIPPADRPRVFERFYKVDRARQRGGTGLGLAIARHIVEAHGGEIWVESREGEGSTFSFSLPYA